MAPYARDGEARVVVAGPACACRRGAAINLGLVVHELATNAAKYGALSAPTGRVDGRLVRRENGGTAPNCASPGARADGPPVKPPSGRGSGRG